MEDTVLDANLKELAREDLVTKIKKLQSHNKQLRNIISSGTKINSERKAAQKCFDFSKCNFRHVLLKFYYLGWDYQGYAVQEDTANTVESYLFHALIKTCLIKDRASSNYHRCGRTDKGVSSFGQTISITLRSKLTKENADDFNNEIDYCGVLNKVLPENIQCIAWCPIAENFSARFDCKSRTYKYFFPKSNLDVKKMQIAAQNFLGTHDFRNFCKMDVANGVTEFVRNILDFQILPVGSKDEGEEDEYTMYVASITGKAFIWHQIRCIMGVLFLIGQSKEEPDIIAELLDVNKNPRKPDYNIASEIPLNLYKCDYGGDLQWQYNEENLKCVIQKLKFQWTVHSSKISMVRSMLKDLEETHKFKSSDNTVINKCLLPGVHTKKYVPLLKRQKCDSLEDRIQRQKKKKKL